ncbi:hypothetical protein VMUT_0120 [Vulcanisaeta moutnovskia 768-28]|uniref:Uncharacterized protein n=1 Tax=Vulcanisaeta moutnovskia (strain 768-28) TaxID=985053 RepID=F0QSI5_VULM7|nr:hypothetical protein [Vulcanisaeta moutnovskia]ADY00336.1 hypothetical protein VMUT_0120 [Vulcanisaeta moutnovskia 768-28]
MGLRITIVPVTVLFSIIAIIIIAHQLYTINTHSNPPLNETNRINNTMITQAMKDYNGSGINYTTIMIERETMARNKHVIRLCNG